MLVCPFCGAPETARLDLEGERFLVFRCMFSPQVDPGRTDAELAEALRATYSEGSGSAYFRGMCDSLHLYVTRGEGGRRLTAATRPPDAPPP